MRNYAENGELCGIVRRTENCAISHSPHLNVASVVDRKETIPIVSTVPSPLLLSLIIPQNLAPAIAK